MIPLSHQNAPPEKIYLSETIRPRALIFGMEHNLVDLYIVYSNYAPRVEIGSTPGVTRDTTTFQQIPICKLQTKLMWAI